MSGGPVLGIDLGTTNSVVAVADGGHARVLSDPEGRRMVPSVVSFLPEGGTVVGYEARERRLVDAANTVYAIKRLIGRPYESAEVASARARFAFEIVPNQRGGSAVRVAQGTFALAEISALVLRELRRVAELALGEPCERAVITVPASFNELQRSATKAAGKVAGLEVLRILNEPTAAALAYGCGGREHERVAVYDLGGGTFDITILELEDDVFEVLATDGDTHLGGEDMDRMIAEAMARRFAEEHGLDLRSDAAAFERLKAAAEWAKCQLSSEDAVELEIEELATLRGRSLDLHFAMTRDELEQLANPWLDRSLEVCTRALAAAGLSSGDLDNVVLVGGSTRMPRCRARVREHFGRTPRSDIDPDLVVAQGAAIHGYALAGSSEPSRARATGGFAPRIAPRRPTQVGAPRQPAFAPDPPRPPAPPARPPAPDGPPSPPQAPVLVSHAVAVRTPRTTLDTTLDALAPPEDELTSALDDLAPAPFSRGAEPLGDLVPDDPFAPPRPGGAPLGLPSLDLDPPLDAPFAPGERPIPSREPTAPFSIDRHAPRPKAPRRELPIAVAPPVPAAVAPPAPVAIAPPMPPPPPRVPPPMPPPRPPREPVQTFVIEAAAPSPPQPIVSMPERPPPLLMDVTPHSLGVETAGGYCRRLILKNAPVPTEQTRTFTTAQDDQREVVVRICQGEDDVFLRNEVLGEVVLDQLPPRRRGALTIEVAFILDVDGTLSVEARDPETGRAQRTSVNLRGGLGAEEIDAMRARHERLA